MYRRYQLRINESVLKIFTTFCFFVLGITATQITFAQNSEILSNKYYSSTITLADDSRSQVSMFFDTDDNFLIQGMPLISIISNAYETSRFLIVDGPDWINTSHLYDIKAVPPPTFINTDNQQMLSNLLADRFKLLTNRASRKMTGLALELKGDDHPFEYLSNDTGLGIKVMTSPSSDIRLEFSFDGLADILSREFNQTVLNLSGLTGTYAVELVSDPPVSSRDFAPLLERMGLQLMSREVETEVLEIINIEHPAIDR